MIEFTQKSYSDLETGDDFLFHENSRVCTKANDKQYECNGVMHSLIEVNPTVYYIPEDNSPLPTPYKVLYYIRPHLGQYSAYFENKSSADDFIKHNKHTWNGYELREA